jgi:hypothetical protein
MVPPGNWMVKKQLGSRRLNAPEMTEMRDPSLRSG